MNPPSLYSVIAGEAGRFRGALAHAREYQSSQLLEILQHNAATEYGRQYGFAGISTAAQFRDRVPVASYTSLLEYIERTAAGVVDVLVPGLPVAFEETGGSSGGAKLIPYTNHLLAAFRRALVPWLDDLAITYPAISKGLAYWAISPAARAPRKTAGGIPVGLPGDAAYFGEALAPLVLETLAVPPSVGGIVDLDEWREATCAHLVACERLALISVWSPTFIDDLLTRLGMQNPHDCATAWPQLQVVSCWDQAASRPYADALRTKLGNIAVQGKGLLATEGVMSIPLHGLAMPVLAVASGFFEFRDATGTCHEAAEATPGGEYDVLLTTWGGLYRYDIGDRVRVHGFAGEAPLIEFIGRGGVASDLCGEKLTEDFVVRALQPLQLRFALLMPSGRGYVLVTDSDELPASRMQAVAQHADAALCANPQYAYARQLGQLAALQVWRCPRPLLRWQQQALVQGRRLGDIKPPALSSRPGDAALFAVLRT